jgi:hypothetical protein
MNNNFLVEVSGQPNVVVQIDRGLPGAPGAGVAPGGTTGQILAKASNANYDTFWTNTGAGSGTVSSVGMTVPSLLSVAGSPITTSGTLAVSYSGVPLPVVNGGFGNTEGSVDGGNY